MNRNQLFGMYYSRGLSAAQNAAELGISKSCVMDRIKKFELKVPRKGRQMNPDNFRHPNPPYGYAAKKGKLVLNKQEIRVCRLVVQGIRDRGLGYREMARELEKRGIKARNGKIKWSHYMTTNIFKRWKEKL